MADGLRIWRVDRQFNARRQDIKPPAARPAQHRDPVDLTFLLSLRQLVETGKGQPAPDDLKIDNWN